ncbi:unnamed protein product [Linum tenue]|uniref:Glycosyltransferase n=2 Tax=Linum tenue TaxID=586396 RepID=A0AAV0KHZ4_9ROSI|nr:unnamed protein product [Linum tenue]
MKVEQQKKQQQSNTKMNTPNPPHVLILPFPFQGHINPALQFSRLLISKGLRVTLIVYAEITTELTQGQLGSLAVHFLSTHDDEEEEPAVQAGGFGFLDRFAKTVKKELPRVACEIERETGSGAACLVYDSVAPWALEVAREMNIPCASFFTQPCAVDAILYSYYEGRIRAPITDKEEKFRVDGMAEVSLAVHDLPSYLHDEDDEYAPECLALLAAQFSNVAGADWVFCNTFTALEEKIVHWMCNKFRFKAVGPTIPSIYLGKQLSSDDTCHEYGLSLFKAQHSPTYLKQWLDSQQPKSVVYVSFGSVASLSDKQTEEVAAALEKLDRPFLWVVRKSEQDKIPPGFVEDTSDRGLVVTWCCQLEVLAHASTVCFVTHCGWNSTIEALSMGVPMVAVPQFADQPTNAKFVEDVWGVGRDGEEKAMARSEEIEWGVVEVMEGERAKGIRKNAEKWKTLARAAVADGGSSDRNIEDFVDELVNLQLLKRLEL